MASSTSPNATEDRTIRDFGEQWTHHGDSDGFYGSRELFADIVAPFLTPADFQDARAAEIGSGAGRIVAMMLECGAAHVLAVEPSDGHFVAQRQLARFGDRVSFLHARGDQIPGDPPLDVIVSVGVLQFIPDPKPTVDAAFSALRPGGQLFVWLYAKEGTAIYRAILGMLRGLGRTLPHPALAALVRLLDVPLALYMGACRVFPLPLRDYLINVLGRFSPQKRRLVIYDQLNPTHAHYHTRAPRRNGCSPPADSSTSVCTIAAATVGASSGGSRASGKGRISPPRGLGMAVVTHSVVYRSYLPPPRWKAWTQYPFRRIATR